jgi:Type VI secretion system/phage-baseplate injector OB domain
MSEYNLNTTMRRFYGKYRGKVTDNADPLMQGRICAKVPAVFGEEETGWALPNAPYGGKGVGIFFVPPTGANVWIEFEEGNPELPIWSGCFWATGEAPNTPATPDVKIIKTDFTTMTINDSVQSVTIETTNKLKIVMNLTGIELSNGNANIKLIGRSVSINDGALVVT